MARGRGGGKTPPRVVELLKKAVAERSQSAVARETGLTLLTVQRYLKGIGEPTSATLELLSTYFDKSVAWLRGEERWPYAQEDMHNMVRILNDLMELYKITPDNLRESLWLAMEGLKSDLQDTYYIRLGGYSEEDDAIVANCIEQLNSISQKFCPDDNAKMIIKPFRSKS